MNFSIPKQSIEGDLTPQVELWLFPNKSQVPANTVMEVVFHLTAFIFKPRSISSREDVVTAFWNTSHDCMHLNLTRLGSRLSRPLQKRSTNESIVTINGTITYLDENTDTVTARQSAVYNDLCTVLSPRTSSRPFLVIKNYCEHEFVPCNQDMHSTQRREISGVDQTGEIAQAPEETITAREGDSACKIVPLIVNLAEVYGEFIMAPREIDVKDCSGQCNNGRIFSKHTEVKRRLRLLPGGENLPYFEPSCVPSEFKPIYMAIMLKDDSDIIVQMPDLLVEGCQCR